MLLCVCAVLAVLLGSGTAISLATTRDDGATSPVEPPLSAALGTAPAPSAAPSTTPSAAPGSATPDAETPEADQPSASPEPDTSQRAEGPAERSRQANPARPRPAPSPSSPPAQRRTGGSVDTSDVTAMENEVVRLTNAERAAAGCGPVTVDERLRTAARGHSQDMADNGYFSHTSLDGRSPFDRMRNAGYPNGAAENIAYGYRTPAEVMNGWMNSEGHRRNLLNCSYVAIGVGLAYSSSGRPYWTQNFGR